MGQEKELRIEIILSFEKENKFFFLDVADLVDLTDLANLMDLTDLADRHRKPLSPIYKWVMLWLYIIL